ncbi:MAG: SUMF1/EgtB/PvdO family nonheme iron enzyme [Polyangiaceae bacterium]|nr:SUMF1/EgtB/PvdO family nonheme iron enzyme [Polyangiaceae bacterium]
MSGRTRDPLGLTGSLLDGKFLVEHAIGEGGAAIVYRATHTTTGTPVAVKFLVTLGQFAPEERAAVLDEFVREGRLISSLSARSSAIVQARDVGVLELPQKAPLPYLVLEWLDGRTLDEVLVSETNGGVAPRSLAESMKLIEPIAGALAIAHERGIAHRDVKPENVFVVEQGAAPGPGGRIKLLDFGIAKVMKRRAPGFHQTGTAVTAFTPHYGAPEQFSRTYGETGTWTDVFAFALVILEVMRGGRRAFEGDDYVELARQSCDEEGRPTPRALRLDVSDEVEAVFARALAVQPSHRYETVGAFWSALLGSVDPRAAGFPLSGPSAAAAARRASSRPPAATTSSATPVSTPKRGGSRAIIAVAAIGAALLIAAAAVTAGLKAARKSNDPASASASSAPSADATVAPNVASTTASAAVTASVPAVLCPAGAVVVPGGRFQMGSETATGDGPRHAVFVDTFCLDRAPVTAKQYASCVELGVCSKPSAEGVEGDAAQCPFGRADAADEPIACVSFDQATTYCGSRGMRLPTEAEWELAASKPNTVDGIGKVGEWLRDWYAPYGASEAVNPNGPDNGTKRVVRGARAKGVAATTPIEITHRESFAPDARSISVGLRCAKALSP